MLGFPVGYGLLFIILGLATAAFWKNMRVWSLVIQGFNLLFATLLSIGLFEMVANALDGAMSVTLFYNDMFAFMVIFIVVLAILMFITSKMTKADLYFEPKTDSICKWIAFFLIFVSFYGTAVFVFYETLPEKPFATKVPPTMSVVEFMAKGSLSPLLGGQPFNTKAFVDGQYKRNAAIYEQEVAGNGWKFDGESPNLK
ncbi:MAG: hypothetical protein HUK22_03605 [Thermoguttaceae bacterium]|nr:hypothetical protein [Thermoguttaceae bacterium]